MILRLSLADGIKFSDGAELDAIIEAHLSEVVVLEPGHYTLTPSVWKRPQYNWTVDVFSDGRGVCRATPRSERSTLTDMRPGQLPVVVKAQRFDLPEGKLRVTICGQLHDGRSGIGVFEVILWCQNESFEASVN